MAEPSQLEQIAKNAPQQEKKVEKPISVLESAINETFDAIKTGVNLGIAAAAPATGYALTGNAGVLATSAAYIAATKGKKDSKIIRNESLSGSIFGTFAHYTLAPLKYLGNLGKVAYMSIWPFTANAFYFGEDHLIKKVSPKGLYKKFKEDYWPITKKTFKTVVPLNIASALFLPQQYMVVSIAVASYIFRRFVAGGKGEEHTDKTSYLATASTGIKKIGSALLSPLRAVYEIGSNLYRPKQPPAAQPA